MNVDYITEADYQGAWEAAWHKHSEEIDRRIVSFMHEGRASSPQALGELTLEIRDWLDSRQISGDAWQQWRRLRREPRLLQSLVEQRIAHLVADGSIRLSGWRSRPHY